jgi:peroxiredoxin
MALPQIVLLCAGQDARPAPQALRAGCSPDDERIGIVNLDDTVEVIRALASGEEICYKVMITRGGQVLTGYVLGDALPAVAAFVNQQKKYRDESFEAQDELERARKESLSRAQPVTAATNPRAAAEPNPDMPADFEEFAGKDVTGKPFSLAGLGGRLILVTFWSPRSAPSKRQLLTLLPLYNQYKRAGLRAVGISMDPNPSHISAALDDITLGWPQIPDRSGLAKRYGVNPATGTTLVLDASHHILAAGLTPSALEKKVRELLAAR